MSSIQKDILQSFFERLMESDKFDGTKIEALKALFEVDKKPNAADVMKALLEDSTEAIP